MALLSLVFSACNQDFDTEFVQQTTLPESNFPANAVSVAPTATTINLINILSDEVPQPIEVGQITLSQPLPANTVLKAEVQVSRDENFAQYATIDGNVVDNKITIDPATLSNAYYGSITKNPAATNLYMRTLLYTVTGSAVAIIGTPGQNFFATQNVPFTPEFRANIAPAYYIVGGPNDWAGSAASKAIKFSHSDKDVYEDPIFTVIFDAAAEGDTWFAIGNDEACDAIANNEEGAWNKLLGIVGGNSQATEGQVDFRYNLGADNSFCVPAGTAKKIKVTLNMLEYTFKVEAVNIADAYYLIGGPGEWNAESAKTMKFSHSSASVADDPVFTYVFAGGSDMWFAFGDEDAINAVAENTWNKLFGTTGASEDLSGSFDRRFNLDGDHSFHVDGSAKFYRFQVNMAEMTYTITPLNFAEYFYEIGNEGGWSTSHALYGPAGDGKYLGYYYLNGEFKFKPNADNWDNDLEYVSGDNLGGTLQSTGGPNCPDPGAGFYQINLDAASMNYSLTKVESISIIGDFNGWGGDVDMTYNVEEGCWEAIAEVNAKGFKFRMNHDWAISWGGANGDGKAYDNLTQNNGANIIVDADGTYKFQLYISYEGNNKVVITKQ